MSPSEIARVEAYLRETFANPRLRIPQPKKPTAPVEVMIGEDFLGVLHRDEDEGEVSYALHITILEEDLAPVPAR